MSDRTPNSGFPAQPALGITRRGLLTACACVWLLPLDEASGAEPQGPDYWWHRFPSFAQGEQPERLFATGAAMAIHGMASDPTWGPFAQHTRALESSAAYRAVRTGGMRVITWIEGFGDCMLYVAALQRDASGKWLCRDDDPSMAKIVRSHWSWASPDAPAGTDIRWIGVHNQVDAEDFTRAAIARHHWSVRPPTYPDGRPAVGVLAGPLYPLNARVYDACGSKDVNGRLNPNFDAPAGVNERDPKTGLPKGPTAGLYPAVAGQDDVQAVAGLKPGEPVWCGVISVHKDLSAPFWRDYARQSVRRIVEAGIDGVWCDNFSPWDNFGYQPVKHAFGDWSVHRFHHEYLPSLPFAERRHLGIARLQGFDVRDAIRAKAAKLGAADPSKLDDPVWTSAEWLDDPVWCAYRAFRQTRARTDLPAFYEAIHAEASALGRPDFCIGGNDIPLFGLGWTRDAWLDMVNTELTPGWHMGTGTRGVMLPPAGKMAVVYAAAHEHQKGPFAAAWYYLDGPVASRQRKPVIGSLLQAEAFANGAFLLCDPGNPRVAGTVESHSAWNAFVRENAARFGSRARAADVGIVFSPDNQLGQLAPGGFPNMDSQPHVFGHWGWATAMVDAHIPYRAVADWKLRYAQLRPLRVLVLPNTEYLEDAALPELERWVRAGGRLIATGACGTRKGPAGRFHHRERPWLASLLGSAPAAASERKLGAGRIAWLPGTPGMDYWLRAEDRPKLVSAMASQVGGSPLLDGSTLPVTVGAFLWRDRKGGAVFVDLVNYALHAHRDEVTPSGPLSFRVRVPAGWGNVKAVAISPDAVEAAVTGVAHGWASVRVASLSIYASVRLTRGTTDRTHQNR